MRSSPVVHVNDCRTSTDNLAFAGLQALKESVQNSPRSKFRAYVSMNPSLSIHPVYSSVSINDSVPEYKRMSFSRLRLISHRLRVETGRWSRIPHDQRLCSCSEAVQTEEHVICHCPMTLSIRSLHDDVIFTFPEFFDSPFVKVCDIIHSCISIVSRYA